jgi:hypothetical protein
MCGHPRVWQPLWLHQIIQREREARCHHAVDAQVHGERTRHTMGISLQRSGHAGPTASPRVRSAPRKQFPILSQSSARRNRDRLVGKADVGASIDATQPGHRANKNPAGGAPRRGDCGPYAEGRVHLRSGQTDEIMSPRGMPVSPIGDSGTENSHGVLNYYSQEAPVATSRGQRRRG